MCIMGNVATKENNQTAVNTPQTSDLITIVTPLEIEIPASMKCKKIRKSSTTSSLSTIKTKPTHLIKLNKTWDTLNLCTYNEWLLNQSKYYNFTNTDRNFYCKGKFKETCTNGFCLYSTNIDYLYKKLKFHNDQFINNRSSTSSNRNSFKLKLKNFILFNKTKYMNNAESRRIMEHFKYNHLPAMFSSFHHYNVKGLIKGNCNDDCSQLLISIYSEITEITRFVLIDLNLNKFLTIFGDYHGYVNSNDCYAVWSSDNTKLLIRLNSSFNNDATNNDNITNMMTSFIDYYDISKREGKLLKRFNLFHKSCIFNIDPTFINKNTDTIRLAITNLNQESTNTMYVIEISSDENKSIRIDNNVNEIIATTSYNQKQNNLKNYKISTISSSSQTFITDLSRNACDLKYSLDGTYLVLTIGDNICCCRALPVGGYTECKYLIFNAYTCQLLKYFTSHLSTCMVHMCPLNYLPRISNCQTRLAIPNKHFNFASSTIQRNNTIKLNESSLSSASTSVAATPGDNDDMHQYQLAARRTLIATKSSNSRYNKLLTNLPLVNSINRTGNNNNDNINLSSLNFTFVKIIEMPTELTLKNLCRVIIHRQIKNKNSINYLNLPNSLKNYLMYTA